MGRTAEARKRVVVNKFLQELNVEHWPTMKTEVKYCCMFYIHFIYFTINMHVSNIFYLLLKLFSGQILIYLYIILNLFI
jgi:hypothetical protein